MGVSSRGQERRLKEECDNKGKKVTQKLVVSVIPKYERGREKKGRSTTDKVDGKKY